MMIFDWEKSVIEVARTWPTSGATYEFFRFWSDYHESMWLVLAIIVICCFKFGWKKIVWPLIYSGVAVIFSDFISRRIVKVLVYRPRPNFVENICSTSKCLGFVSSHATNVSAVAMFLCLYDKRNTYWALPCVLLVGFSRIYLLDHFPLDVLGGFALGALVGASLWKLHLIFAKMRNLNLRGK